MRFEVAVVLHTAVNFVLRTLLDFFNADGARAVQVFCVAQHAIAHVLGCKTAFLFVVKTNLVVACRRQVHDVLGQRALFDLLTHQAARFDVGGFATLF